LAHYALSDIEEEDILEEGLQCRDGEMNPLHSLPDCITVSLAVDVLKESILFQAEEIQVLG
jgi:hypothetical protein